MSKKRKETKIWTVLPWFHLYLNSSSEASGKIKWNLKKKILIFLSLDGSRVLSLNASIFLSFQQQQQQFMGYRIHSPDSFVSAPRGAKVLINYVSLMCGAGRRGSYGLWQVGDGLLLALAW